MNANKNNAPSAHEQCHTISTKLKSIKLRYYSVLENVNLVACCEPFYATFTLSVQKAMTLVMKTPLKFALQKCE